MSPKLKLWAKRLKGPKRNTYRLQQVAMFGRAACLEVVQKRKSAA